jgi:hypothetical protein
MANTLLPQPPQNMSPQDMVFSGRLHKYIQQGIDYYQIQNHLWKFFHIDQSIPRDNNIPPRKGSM